MGEVAIDAQVFWERLSKLHKQWVRAATPHALVLFAVCEPPSVLPAASQNAARDSEGALKGVDALVIDSGANNEEEVYSKSKSLQTWLLGYEFPETVILVCSRSVHVLTSKKKGEAAASPATTRMR